MVNEPSVFKPLKFYCISMPDDYKPDVALARSSQDYFVNVSGRKFFDFCKLNGLRICNGKLGTDKGIGKYTYVGSRGSSVVDYVIVSEPLLNNISQFCVGDPIYSIRSLHFDFFANK